MGYLEIFFITIIILGFILVAIGVKENGFAASAGGIGLLFLTLASTSLLKIKLEEITPREPTALDVYRGRTTLQITYQDSVAVDTTVVWKPEFRGKQ